MFKTIENAICNIFSVNITLVIIMVLMIVAIVYLAKIASYLKKGK